MLRHYLFVVGVLTNKFLHFPGTCLISQVEASWFASVRSSQPSCQHDFPATSFHLFFGLLFFESSIVKFFSFTRILYSLIVLLPHLSPSQLQSPLAVSRFGYCRFSASWDKKKANEKYMYCITRSIKLHCTVQYLSISILYLVF